MKAAILIDSTAGLSEEYLQQDNVFIANLSVIFADGTEIIDSTDDQVLHDFYLRMSQEKTLPTTSQPSLNQVYQIYDEIIAQGYDTVFGLFISNEISGTYQTMVAAAQNYQDRLNFYLMDSKSTSYCMEGLFINLNRLIEAQLEPEMIVQEMQVLIDLSVFYFTISTLDNLVKGGRVSALSGMIGNLLKIKPILYLGGPTAGSVEVKDKVRTRKKAISAMLKYAEADLDLINGPFYLTIGHTGAQEEAEAIRDYFQNIYTHQQVRVGYISPVLGTHGGANAISINIVPLIEFQ